MSHLSRRTLLKGALSGLTMASVPGVSWPSRTLRAAKAESSNPFLAGAIRRFRLEELCAAAAKLGLKAIDLLNPDEYEVPRRYGLVCSMGYAGGGEIVSALNRVENHARIEEGFRKYIRSPPRQACQTSSRSPKSRRPLRRGRRQEHHCRTQSRQKDRRGPRRDRLLELLNSKVDHKDYMCDRTAWGVGVVQAVNSSRVKLLFDIYHMQIMEGDLVRTIQQNIQSLGHFHTGGVPGRHELDNTQEVQWDGVMRGIVATGFQGYVAHEFVPRVTRSRPPASGRSVRCLSTVRLVGVLFGKTRRLPLPSALPCLVHHLTRTFLVSSGLLTSRKNAMRAPRMPSCVLRRT